MFEHFSQQQSRVNGVMINYRIGGQGPGLLLLHGHPQTHVMWHKVADELARHFTVVAADLRGYGDSEKPLPSADHLEYSKREMAADMAELMKVIGFEQFSLLAHDRGARVAHRLGVDHAASVKRMVFLDIAPTLGMYENTTEAFARAYWHWFFLIRPAPFPESLIQSDPELYIQSVMGARSAGMAPFTAEALAEYLRCLRLPGTAMAICEDYRAAAGIDLEHDREDLRSGTKLDTPLLVMWGEEGAVGRCFDPMSLWHPVASDVQGKPLPCGHYIAEEMPERLIQETLAFLT
ncbi:Haloacetate dehalogenase H-1 [Marinobacterium lacunae]|uniref:Haloacetate dehalogenase H-1 n=1 Tax=Marinobacterium lacunae TaxID=1232683 RepID=A0A081FUD4_9GAMM|nr:alpha/beta hydrolase [Marinobacterium lacunae]KEA62139.1 Haloacetate dehalogenase H-1 [Marinobacterium lacunae]